MPFQRIEKEYSLLPVEASVLFFVGQELQTVLSLPDYQ
jgi:hypothetical protein